jgi:formate dehydrogenase
MLINADVCVGCETCQPYCPVDAIHTVPGTGEASCAATGIADKAAGLEGVKQRGERKEHPSARKEVKRLLGPGARRRELLVEYLHLLQDHWGHISSSHLAALAGEVGLSRAEAYEVATFYAHFDVVGEEEKPPPEVTVRVCAGVSCELDGGRRLLQELVGMLGEDVRVVTTPCMGACETSPAAMAGQRRIGAATAQVVADAVAAKSLRCDDVPFRDFEAYRKDGGYRLLRECLGGGLTRASVIDEVEQADLRGRGGAGFPVARKWRLLANGRKPKYMVINADEGEPGAFKDRHCLETDPHRVLEGALISAWTVEAEEVFLYLRNEYAHIRAILEREIPRIEAAGLVPKGRLHLRRGAGAYVCGEETALLESLEGKRGHPRVRPPFPAQAGLFGCPTLVSNVESLYWLPDILERGAQWFIGAGRPRFYSVSGRVREPGVKLAPSGITARRLIEDFSGGMMGGHEFKAFLPGGASGGILPAAMGDLPLEEESLAAHGCSLGSAGLVVLSDKDEIQGVVQNLLRFFEGESCGQCTPCRTGIGKLLKLAEEGSGDGNLATELGSAMRETSICGLGQAVPNPVLSALRFFPGEMK